MATKSTEYFHSRYVTGGLSDETTDKIGWWERKYFPIRADDSNITIPKQYDRRPDLMADRLYGRVELMWVVLMYNNIVDIEEEFIAGKRIRVPSKERVNNVILRRPTRK